MARFEFLSRMTRRLALAVQAFLLPVCLFFAYFVGLGLTWPFAALSRRGPLRRWRGDEPTFWLPVEDGEPDLEDCARQS